MRASDLIEELEQLIEKYGDLEVAIPHEDCVLEVEITYIERNGNEYVILIN